jgi:hypothetical protein
MIAVASDVPTARVEPRAPVDPYARATLLLASVAAFVVGFDFHTVKHSTAALPLAIVILPLWLPILRKFPLATVIAALTGVAIVSGLLLAERSSIDHNVSHLGAIQAIALVTSGIAALILLLWAGTKMPLSRVVLLYGAGALSAAAVHGDFRWKFQLAVPVTLIVLAWLERNRLSIGAALVMFGFGIIDVASDGRSLFAASVLAATLTIWQLRPRSATAKERRWFPIILIVGVALAIYLFTTALATGGALGQDVQQRSTAESSSGSLLTGGRPEWGATRALIHHNPMGYGLGVVPNFTDRQIGKEGLIAVGNTPDPFREQYMFGQQLELHSVASDLWAGFGWMGVALAATIAFALARGWSFALAARQAPAYLSFAVIIAFWYVLFGPLASNWLDVCSALAFAILAGHPSRLAPGTQRSDSPRAADAADDVAPARASLTGGHSAPAR